MKTNAIKHKHIIFTCPCPLTFHLLVLQRKLTTTLSTLYQCAQFYINLREFYLLEKTEPPSVIKHSKQCHFSDRTT